MPMEIEATGVVNCTADYYKASVGQMTALEIVSKTVVEEPNPSQATSMVENNPTDENVAFKSETPPESTKTVLVNPPGPSELPTLVAPVQVKNNVGKYRLLRTIGKGNFAKVKLAIHMATGVEVAIKIINKTMMDGTLLKRLKREITIMKITNHPNIGEIFDYLVANGKMREKEARVKFRQLLSAIQYCHSKRIVHRDLKAENILLDGNLSVKVADFGLANTFAPDQRLNTFCGSPPYAAPELFLGIPYYGPGVDVWSLGVILFTLVLGHLPFDARDLRELRSKIIGLHYSIPKNSISPECEALLRKMLVLDPKDRSSLKVLMQDKWVNMGYAPSDFLRPHKECSRSQLDEVRVEAMEAMGFTRADLESSVVNPEFDHVYATYHLLPETPSQFVVLYDQVPPTPTTQTQVAVTFPNNLMTSQTNAVQARPSTESAQQQPVAIGRFTVAPSGAISVDPPSRPVHDNDHVGQVTTSHRSNIAGPESAVREHHSLTSSLPTALKRAFAQMGRTFGAGGGANSSVVSGQHIEANSRTFTQTTNSRPGTKPMSKQNGGRTRAFMESLHVGLNLLMLFPFDVDSFPTRLVTDHVEVVSKFNTDKQNVITAAPVPIVSAKKTHVATSHPKRSSPIPQTVAVSMSTTRPYNTDSSATNSVNRDSASVQVFPAPPSMEQSVKSSKKKSSKDSPSSQSSKSSTNQHQSIRSPLNPSPTEVSSRSSKTSEKHNERKAVHSSVDSNVQSDVKSVTSSSTSSGSYCEFQDQRKSGSSVKDGLPTLGPPETVDPMKHGARNSGQSIDGSLKENNTRVSTPVRQYDLGTSNIQPSNPDVWSGESEKHTLALTKNPNHLKVLHTVHGNEAKVLREEALRIQNGTNARVMHSGAVDAMNFTVDGTHTNTWTRGVFKTLGGLFTPSKPHDQRTHVAVNTTGVLTGPREVRFPWSVHTTSTKSAEDVLKNIVLALELTPGCRYAYDQHLPFLLRCSWAADRGPLRSHTELNTTIASASPTTESASLNPILHHSGLRDDPVHWEMEVCQLPRLHLRGVRLKRIRGSTLQFRPIADLVMKSLHL
ncbi:hypothetical protein P879_05703 [Paragonimus westermani]|uniref:non-specific serine/threonine protein kinase n=1 Tax=Paragonimus westermani TaxID=34504 RepID=A0A8T0DMP0_9TREM|nr:hypothetical protein P879_05703 [Paragonimus westermani]